MAPRPADMCLILPLSQYFNSSPRHSFLCRAPDMTSCRPLATIHRPSLPKFVSSHRFITHILFSSTPERVNMSQPDTHVDDNISATQAADTDQYSPGSLPNDGRRGSLHNAALKALLDLPLLPPPSVEAVERGAMMTDSVLIGLDFKIALFLRDSPGRSAARKTLNDLRTLCHSDGWDIDGVKSHLRVLETTMGDHIGTSVSLKEEESMLCEHLPRERARRERLSR